MDTKSHKLTDARREMFYAELHALLGAGLDFSAAFRLLIESESDRRTKALLEGLYAAASATRRDVWHGRSTSCATTTVSGPRSGAWSPRP